jgi:hypothetical protein
MTLNAGNSFRNGSFSGGTQTARAREDMPNAGQLPSLIDDADFLAELDKLETTPARPRPDAHHVSRPEGVDEDRVSAPVQAAVAPAPVRQTRSAKPVQPVRIEKPLRLEPPSGPGRIENPFRPAAPARFERPAKPERPVHPGHVDEIGDAVASGVAVRQEVLVPATLVALTVVLCLGAGAGSAALVFHDRVAQIAVTWKK